MPALDKYAALTITTLFPSLMTICTMIFNHVLHKSINNITLAYNITIITIGIMTCILWIKQYIKTMIIVSIIPIFWSIDRCIDSCYSSYNSIPVIYYTHIFVVGWVVYIASQLYKNPQEMHIEVIVRPIEVVVQPIPTIMKFSQIKNIRHRDEIDTCCICLEKFKDEDDMRCLSCAHYGHKTCYESWLQEKNICPLCKKNNEQV
jgi:hypothetical protein